MEMERRERDYWRIKALENGDRSSLLANAPKGRKLGARRKAAGLFNFNSRRSGVTFEEVRQESRKTLKMDTHLEVGYCLQKDFIDESGF